ncbi:MAG: hypothetical protein PW790_06630 [Parvibaculaceae bacterium]|nr:hypothetical protein [Parvibaculaceae bacterium]
MTMQRVPIENSADVYSRNLDYPEVRGLPPHGYMRRTASRITQSLASRFKHPASSEYADYPRKIPESPRPADTRPDRSQAMTPVWHPSPHAHHTPSLQRTISASPATMVNLHPAPGLTSPKASATRKGMEEKMNRFQKKFITETARDTKDDGAKLILAAEKWRNNIEAAHKKYAHPGQTSPAFNEVREKAYQNLYKEVERRAVVIYERQVSGTPALKTSKDLKRILEQRTKISSFHASLRRVISELPVTNPGEMAAMPDRRSQEALDAFDLKFSESFHTRINGKLQEDISKFQRSYVRCDTIKKTDEFIHQAERYRASIDEYHRYYMEKLKDVLSNHPSINLAAASKRRLLECINENNASAIARFNRETRNAVSCIYDQFVESQTAIVNSIPVYNTKTLAKYDEAIHHSHDKLLRLTKKMNTTNFIAALDIEADLPTSSFRKIIGDMPSLHNIRNRHDAERSDSRFHSFRKRLSPKLIFPGTVSKVLMVAGIGTTIMGLALVTLIPGTNVLAGVALIAVGCVAIAPFVIKHLGRFFGRVGTVISKLVKKETIMEKLREMRDSAYLHQLPELASAPKASSSRTS